MSLLRRVASATAIVVAASIIGLAPIGSASGATASPIVAAVSGVAPATVDQIEPAATRAAQLSDSDVPTHPKKAKKNTTTLVVMAYSSKKDSTTAAQLKKMYFTTVDRWMRWESNGKQGEKGKVTRWLKVANVCSSDSRAVAARAYKAAKKAGYKPSKYKRIAIYFPTCSNLPWAGLGDLGGKAPWNVWLNGKYAVSVRVIAHESLHNYGLQHAASVDCGSKSLPPSTSKCTFTEYGDPFDVMGDSDYALSASDKATVGWLNSSQKKTLKKGSTTVTLHANESTRSGKKLIRVPMGSGKYLDVEYRASLGLDGGLVDTPAQNSFDAQSGVQVRLVKRPSYNNDFARSIIDVQPNNDTEFASIPAGQSWTSYNHIRISVLSSTPDRAVVIVSFKAPGGGVPATPAAPTFTTTLSPYGDGAVGTAAISPASGNGMPVLTYEIETASSTAGSTARSVDAFGGVPATIDIGSLPFGSTYAERVRAKTEVATGAWSDWSATATVVEPTPVIGATSVDGGTVDSSYRWRDVTVVVQPTPGTGTTITEVDISIAGASGLYGRCNAELAPGSSDTWQCSSAYYQYDSTLETGANSLTVDAYDSSFHDARKTVAFTVTP